MRSASASAIICSSSAIISRLCRVERRVVLHQLDLAEHELAVVLEVADDLEDRGAHRGERTLGRRAVAQRLAQEREPVRVVGEERVLLGVEVAEEGAGRDVGCGGDLLDGDVLEAALGARRRVASAISWRVRSLLRSRSPSVAPAVSLTTSDGTGMRLSVP